MRYPAILPATAFLLVACDQRAPTEPTPRALSPVFQVGQDRVSVSLSGNADWLTENLVNVNGSFTCPESETAVFEVNVTQVKTDGTTQTGFAIGDEACKFGTNKWTVTVGGGGAGWDKGPAVATVTMFPTSGGSDSDQGDIHIR